MKKVKITVLKTTFQDDLAREYGVDGLGACPMHRPGEVVLKGGLQDRNLDLLHGVLPFVENYSTNSG